jgi:hypothetical protein
LLHKGADVDARDHEGITTLHWASSAGHLGVVQVRSSSDSTLLQLTGVQALVQAGANLNLTEADGNKLTPLDYALVGDGQGRPHQEIVDYLQQRGAMGIGGVEERAAVCIQAVWRGHRARRSSGFKLSKTSSKQLQKELEGARKASRPKKSPRKQASPKVAPNPRCFRAGCDHNSLRLNLLYRPPVVQPIPTVAATQKTKPIASQPVVAKLPPLPTPVAMTTEELEQVRHQQACPYAASPSQSYSPCDCRY